MDLLKSPGKASKWAAIEATLTEDPTLEQLLIVIKQQHKELQALRARVQEIEAKLIPESDELFSIFAAVDDPKLRAAAIDMLRDAFGVRAVASNLRVKSK